jgi:hypothetical protein
LTERLLVILRLAAHDIEIANRAAAVFERAGEQRGAASWRAYERSCRDSWARIAAALVEAP